MLWYSESNEMSKRNARLVRRQFQGTVFLLRGHSDYVTYAYCSKSSSIFDNFIFIRQLKLNSSLTMLTTLIFDTIWKKVLSLTALTKAFCKTMPK